MTRTIVKLLGMTVAIGVGVACTNSGLGGTGGTLPTGANPTGPGTGTGTGTGGGTGSCEFVGTWAVNGAWCGSFDIQDDWFSLYSTATMDITDSGSNDGSCKVDFSWNNADCSEQEKWTITSTEGGVWTIRFRGIESCAPDQCTFYAGDDSCAVGERAFGDSLDFDAEILQATQIRLVGVFADSDVWASSGYPQCSLDLTTEWVKE